MLGNGAISATTLAIHACQNDVVIAESQGHRDFASESVSSSNKMSFRVHQYGALPGYYRDDPDAPIASGRSVQELASLANSALRKC